MISDYYFYNENKEKMAKVTNMSNQLFMVVGVPGTILSHVKKVNINSEELIEFKEVYRLKHEKELDQVDIFEIIDW